MNDEAPMKQTDDFLRRRSARGRRFFVYRCPPSETLEKAAELSGMGARTIAPSVIVTTRLPRSKKRIDVPRPLLPGFVFVEGGFEDAANRLISSNKVRSVRAVRLNGIPCACHWLEISLIDPKGLELSFAIGEEVEVVDGPLKGMDVVVSDYDNKNEFLFVEVMNSILFSSIKISPFLVRKKER